MTVAFKDLSLLIQTARSLEAAYIANRDPLKEADALSRLEDAEAVIDEVGSHTAVSSYLLGLLDATLAIADEASGAVHKGTPYEIGKAKREAAVQIASSIRRLLATTRLEAPRLR